MMTKQETIRTLIDILAQANLSDTPEAMDWQDPSHASTLYGHIRAAIELIEPGRVAQWAINGE